VSRLTLAPHRHDPYWDVDGSGAQRLRAKRRLTRVAVWCVVLLVLAFAVTRLPSIDPTYLVQGEGRPVMAAALLGLLGAAAILALARIHASRAD
jgi:cytochrome bd-type quinol oxidase subunit 2